jgi:iron complex transport system substrate-binding protein
MRLAATTVAVILGLSLGACTQADNTPQAPYGATEFAPSRLENLTDRCVADFDPTIDYFPEKTTFSESSQLTVSYHGHYKRLLIKPSASKSEVIEILLVQCGTPQPNTAMSASPIIVQVPARKIATATRALLGAADRLDIVDRFVGVDDIRGITVASFARRAAEGRLLNLSGHAHGNIEPLMSVMPDVYFTFYSAYPQFNIHPKLIDLGVRAIPFADGLEATPLGRAEWLKVLALVTNTESRANQSFGEIATRYRDVQRLLASMNKSSPLVLAGSATQRGVMELFGGANHRAAMIDHAGGRYVLAGNKFPGSWLVTSFERVYAAGANADVWIGVRPGTASIDALIAANPHHRWFEKSIAQKDIYALDRGYRGWFAHHFEDQALDNPDVLLREIGMALGRIANNEPDGTMFLRKLK